MSSGNKVKVSTIRTAGAKLQVSDLSVAPGVLAELFDHAPDLAFFVKDSAGRYVAVNASVIWGAKTPQTRRSLSPITAKPP